MSDKNANAAASLDGAVDKVMKAASLLAEASIEFDEAFDHEMGRVTHDLSEGLEKKIKHRFPILWNDWTV